MKDLRDLKDLGIHDVQHIERRGNAFKRFEDFNLNDMAEIWTSLSYMRHIRSTAVHRSEGQRELALDPFLRFVPGSHVHCPDIQAI